MLSLAWDRKPSYLNAVFDSFGAIFTFWVIYAEAITRNNSSGTSFTIPGEIIH